VQELNLVARKKCDEKIKAFADCAEVNGLMVVFRCREHNDLMNNCLHQYTNEAAFDVFRRAKAKEGLA
jgi:COX assembly protein 1